MSIASIEGRRRGRAHIFMLPDMSATSYVYIVITPYYILTYIHTFIHVIHSTFSY